jgi:hypothetical protein
MLPRSIYHALLQQALSGSPSDKLQKNASAPKRFATMPYDLPPLSTKAAEQHVTIHIIPHTHGKRTGFLHPAPTAFQKAMHVAHC